MIFGDLTTLDDMKRWLSLGGPPGSGQAAMSNVDDDLLQKMITRASATIQSWCNRSFHLQNWLEVRDGYGPMSTRFSFAAWPVRSVAQVTIAGVTIPAVPFTAPAAPGMAVATFYTAHAGYTFTPMQLFVRGYYVPREPQCVTLVYTAGYDPIPDDLQQACIEMVGFKYRERGRIGERSRALPQGGSVNYQGPLFTRADAIASDIQATIEQYQAVVPIASYLEQLSIQTSATVAAGLEFR